MAGVLLEFQSQFRGYALEYDISVIHHTEFCSQ